MRPRFPSACAYDVTDGLTGPEIGARQVNVNDSYEDARRLFWDAVNLRDGMRHCDDPRLNLLAFRLNDTVEELGQIVERLSETEPADV